MLGEKRKPTQNLLYQLLISPCQRLAQILFSHLTTTRHVARFEPYITFRDGAHQNVVVCFNSVFHANFAPVNALQKTFREIVCEPQYRDVSIAKVGFSITEIKVSVKVDYIEIAPTRFVPVELFYSPELPRVYTILYNQLPIYLLAPT